MSNLLRNVKVKLKGKKKPWKKGRVRMRQEAKGSPDSSKMTFIQSEELESLAVIANTLVLHHRLCNKELDSIHSMTDWLPNGQMLILFINALSLWRDPFHLTPRVFFPSACFFFPDYISFNILFSFTFAKLSCLTRFSQYFKLLQFTIKIAN